MPALLLCAGCERSGYEAPATERWIAEDEHGPVEVRVSPAPVAREGELSRLRTSCDGGDREACGALATFLLNAGQHLEAEEIWYRSCLAGHGPSCADLGYQYNNPFLHLAHPERALDVLTRGCEAAEHPPIACASLAERYDENAQTRYGTSPDPARHRALLERACRDGHYGSCDALGLPLPGR